MLNGHENTKPKIRQKITAGAVVRLDDAVVEHGVLFIHPMLPPIKLYMEVDAENHTIGRYYFDVIRPEHGEQTQFAVELHEVGQPQIMVPDKKLIV